MKKSWKARICTFCLCAVLFASTGFGIFGFGAPRAVQPSSATLSDLEDVTGQWSLDDIRQSQFDKAAVTKNEFPASGRGTVIIQPDEDSLFRCYADTDGKTSFTDYIETKAGINAAQSIEKKQNAVLSAMRKAGIDFSLQYTYTALTDAFAVEMSYKDVAAVRKIAGVKSVYYSNTYAAPDYIPSDSDNDANVYSTGIYNTEGIDYTGAGMKVAILDTGLDYTHNAFLHMPEGSDIWTQEDIDKIVNPADGSASKLLSKARVPSLQTSDVYVNAKVPYAFDYADNDANVYPSYSTHGTHVAGIIAGKDESKTVGENGETFLGVAPDAQLVIMKVFTDDLDSSLLGGANTADILAAINDCAVLGVDVINMSLGSEGGFSSETTDEFLTQVYGAVGELGISLIVAAGNESSAGYGGGNGMNLASDPDSGTVGSPSTYGPALSVASINGQESPYFLANAGTDNEAVAFVTNAADLNSNDIEFVDEMLAKFKNDPSVYNAATGELKLRYVVVPGVGRSSNYTATVRRALADGKTLALVRRGDISFSDKVQYAMNAGAAGVVIYNNLSGEIRMSLADLEDPVPACSVDLNAGTAMVNGATASVGTVTINATYTAGPFMSSFSGLGVTPDLKLKPEITAHGGEIFSAVPGGYDTYSGTSMAAPNMAGAAALLRQHLKETYGIDGVRLNALLNQRAMSTATIANNPVGNPYSPRKQGAGLANIANAINSPAYLRVPDGNDGYTDKTKLEYGDDVQKTGVYTFTFTATNASATDLTYSFSSFVFTETLAINKKTVEETAYMFPDASVTFVTDNGVTNGSEGTSITVPANGNVDITVTVRLSDKNKAYLNESFVNGMYVEGFFRLLATTQGLEEKQRVDLSVPYLAFYGDWSAAPMFDYTLYELAVTDADQSIEEADKPKASARETTPLGLYNDAQYIMPLGSFLYAQDEDEVEIFPSSDKAAISIYDDDSRRTIYELYMIYGGLLRGAKTLHITVTDAVTGETVFDETQYNVRKAYANGGSNVGSPIMVEMSPAAWGLANNREYIFKMQGTLDWGDGTANKDTFEFNFHVDYEAPRIDSYSVRFEPYTENKETKYRIYLDVNVYDNQYAQSLLPCYVKNNTLMLMTEYVVPVYSSANSVTKVSLDITDFYDDYYNDIYLGVEDYAMNQSLYHLNLTNATKYCESMSFATDDGKLTPTGTRNGTTNINGETIRYVYPTYSITMQPNEAYTLRPDVSPSDTYSYKLNWSSGAPNVAVAYENQIFAKTAGTSIVSVKDGTGLTKAQITVKVAGGGCS